MSNSTDRYTNPLLAPSSLPFGLPDFAQISDRDYEPAIQQAMDDQLAAIAAITADPEPASFQNTLVPLELSRVPLTRALAVFSNATATITDDALDDLDAALAPRLAAHRDAIMLDSALYQRVRAVAEGGETLDAESRYLVDRYLTEFKLAGAALSDADKELLRELNGRIATLERRFKIELQKDTADLALLIDDPAGLDGLTSGELSAAAQAAAERGQEGKYLLTLVLPTGHPYLASLTDPAVRERLSAAQRARGSRGNDHDTRAVILEMVQIRAQLAGLLGFEDYASWVIADSMAKTPQAATDLLLRLAKPAAANAALEQQSLERSAGRPIGVSDWPFYAERVRAAEYDVDLAALRPYFQAERVLKDGVFYAAGQLFGLKFIEREDIPAYHPDVRVFEVTEEDGTPVALYLLDLYARDSKRGGAWMGSFVDQATLAGSDTSVVYNVLNVPKPAPGEATLLTYDETETLFHEFGHALHGMLAKSTYPSLAGTEVFTDFVEFPSQFFEMWMLWPQVLSSYAVHHETGEGLPEQVIARLRATQTFNQGYLTSEYLGAAIVDLAWHSLAPGQVPTGPAAVQEFEARVLKEAGLDNPALPPRYATPYFAHAFSFSYEASYYSYIWAQVFAEDTAAWFDEQDGLSLREKGEQYRQNVIGFGGTRDPLEAYVAWRGRPAPIEPLLAARGLTAGS